MLLHYFETSGGRRFAVMYDRFSIYFSGKKIGGDPLAVKIENKGMTIIAQFGDSVAQVVDGSIVQVGEETPKKKNLERVFRIEGEVVDRRQRQMLGIGIVVKNLELPIKCFFVCVFHIMSDAGSFVR
jgi:hypothetical protein